MTNGAVFSHTRPIHSATVGTRLPHALALLLVTLTLQAAQPDPWYARVETLMTPSEKKVYLNLSPKERPAFEQNFWSGRAITQEDYLDRVAYADERYGSSKPGSAANTDRGRVHLALGPPSHTTRLPSSRTFFPIEIWYYAEAQNLDIHYELQLLFYQRNGTGEYKLYFPSLNTIKDLMNPQGSTRGLFAVNGAITESEIRTRLTLSPAEGEVIDASVSVARGIKGMGNEQILAIVASPQRALSRDIKTRVTARLLTDHPALTTFQTTATDRNPQVDIAVDILVRDSVILEVQEGNITLARYETGLHFTEARQVRYEHRLHLLPGEYRVMLTADGRAHPYAISVPSQQPAVGPMLTGMFGLQDHTRTPFEFHEMRFSPSDSANTALIELARPGRITWRLRHGTQIIWNTHTTGEGIVAQPIGDRTVPPGAYTLEASVNGETRSQNVRIGDTQRAQIPVISYNANLAPAERSRSLGHQYLARGNASQAKQWLEKAWTAQADSATKIELCRVAALTGHYDEARSDLEGILAKDPKNFEALSTLAYVEVGLQDYVAAERVYARALTIRKSAALETALANVRMLK